MTDSIDIPIKGVGKVRCLNPERTPSSVAIFVADAEADVEKIPEYTPLGNTFRRVINGSACYVIETGEWWVKNGAHVWVKRMFDRFYLDLITQEIIDRKHEDQALFDDLEAHKKEVADDEVLGHVRLSDDTDLDKGIHDGMAATPRAVKEVMDYAKGLLAASDAMVFKGTVGSGGTVLTLPAKDYSAGWCYKVTVAGTYAGQKCEPGDLIVAVKDWSDEASDADWTVIQTNIDGAVTGPVSAKDGHVAVFDGASGKIIKDSGFTIGASVPADAKFTDTVYVHPTDPGFRHIPAGGKENKYLKWEADGRATWADLPDFLSYRGLADATNFAASLSGVNWPVVKGAAWAAKNSGAIGGHTVNPGDIIYAKTAVPADTLPANAAEDMFDVYFEIIPTGGASEELDELIKNFNYQTRVSLANDTIITVQPKAGGPQSTCMNAGTATNHVITIYDGNTTYLMEVDNGKSENRADHIKMQNLIDNLKADGFTEGDGTEKGNTYTKPDEHTLRVIVSGGPLITYDLTENGVHFGEHGDKYETLLGAQISSTDSGFPTDPLTYYGPLYEVIKNRWPAAPMNTMVYVGSDAGKYIFVDSTDKPGSYQLGALPTTGNYYLSKCPVEEEEGDAMLYVNAFVAGGLNDTGESSALFEMWCFALKSGNLYYGLAVDPYSKRSLRISQSNTGFDTALGVSEKDMTIKWHKVVFEDQLGDIVGGGGADVEIVVQQIIQNQEVINKIKEIVENTEIIQQIIDGNVVANSHTHANKAVLDTVTQAEVKKWNDAADLINSLINGDEVRY